MHQSSSAELSSSWRKNPNFIKEALLNFPPPEEETLIASKLRWISSSC
jgi:hypothetical protein